MTQASIGMGGAHRDPDVRSVEWWTPQAIFDALGVRFDLDPCAPPFPAAPWLPVDQRYSLPDDGLALDWSGRVWLNPPYGREAASWVRKLVAHGNGIALVFVRSDAAWGQEAIESADAVCLIRGRLSFVDGAGQARARKGHNAANGSMLLAYGPDCAAAVRRCGLGVVLAPTTRRMELVA